MNCGQPRILIDPYEWLPSYGESQVNISSKGRDWGVEIRFDGGGTELVSRRITFLGVSSFWQSAFPGADISGMKRSMPENLGALIEFPNSEAAQKWSNYWNTSRKVRHFFMVFLSENLMIEVFADSYELSPVGEAN